MEKRKYTKIQELEAKIISMQRGRKISSFLPLVPFLTRRKPPANASGSANILLPHHGSGFPHDAVPRFFQQRD